MGTACSSKKNDQAILPPNTMSNEVQVVEIEKQIKLLDQRYRISKEQCKLIKIISGDEENKIDTLPTTTLKHLQEELNKIAELEQLSQKIEQCFKQIQDFLNNYQNGNQKEVGKQSLMIRSQFRQLEDVVTKYQQQLNGIREFWVEAFYTEGIRQKIFEKISIKKQKLDKQNKIFIYTINYGEQIRNQYDSFLKEISSNYDNHFSHVIQLLHNDLDGIVRTLDQAYFFDNQSEIDAYQAQLTSKKFKQKDFDTVSQLASNMKHLRIKLRDYTNNIQGTINYIQEKINILNDFGLAKTAEGLNQYLEILMNEWYQRACDNLKSYKESLEVDMMSAVDEDNVNYIKEQEELVKDYEEQLELLFKSKPQLKKQIQDLLQSAQNHKKIDFLSSRTFRSDYIEYQRLTKELENLRQKMLDIDTEIEIKKVENDKINILDKLNLNNTLLDHLYDQFNEIQQETSDILEACECLKEALQKKQNHFSLLISEYLGALMRKLIQYNEIDQLKQSFKDCEMKINNLMNFWTEKQESGEGINNPEDASHLINEIYLIEQQSGVLDSKILMFKNGFNVKKEMIKVLLKQTIQLIAKILANEIKINSKAQEIYHSLPIEREFQQESKVKDHEIAQQREKFNQLQSKKSSNLIDQIKIDGIKYVDLLDFFTKQIFTIELQLKDLLKFSDIIMVWGDDRVQLDTPLGLENINIPYEEYTIQDENDPVEIKLSNYLNEDPRGKQLKIQKLKDSIYQFGQSYKTKLKLIGDQLCTYIVGGYIDFEDFVKFQYLSILEKERLKQVKNLINEFHEEEDLLLQSLKPLE